MVLVTFSGRVVTCDDRATSCCAEAERAAHKTNVSMAKLRMSFDEIFMVVTPSRLRDDGERLYAERILSFSKASSARVVAYFEVLCVLCEGLCVLCSETRSNRRGLRRKRRRGAERILNQATTSSRRETLKQMR